MRLIKQICSITLVLVTTLIYAQQNITYKGKTFKKSEIVDVQIGNSGETFSFYISEHDMSSNGAWAKEVRRLESLGKVPNPEDAPKGLSLNLSVYLKNGLPFPIKPKDSIVLSLSDIKNQMDERKFFDRQASKIDDQKAKAKALTEKKVTLEAQAKEIAKQMQAGKISPDEAMKQIEALTKPMMKDIEKTSAFNVEIKEPEDKSNYSIAFSDTNVNEAATPVTGYLYIVEFNKNKLVAYISGKHFVECTDVARKNSKIEVCKQVNSQLIGGLQVLREEPFNLSINTTFNNFRDNRN